MDSSDDGAIIGDLSKHQVEEVGFLSRCKAPRGRDGTAHVLKSSHATTALILPEPERVKMADCRFKTLNEVEI